MLSSITLRQSRPCLRSLMMCRMLPPTTTKAVPSSLGHFHTSSLTLLPIRRRRPRHLQVSSDLEGDSIETKEESHPQSSSSPDKDDSSSSPVWEITTEPGEFAKVASTLMDEVYRALVPIQAQNDNVTLIRDVEEGVGEYILADLGPGNGQFHIQMDMDDQTLSFQTPISGQRHYVHQKASNQWCDVDDGHNFKGLLVRDMIRQVPRGVPNL